MYDHHPANTNLPLQVHPIVDIKMVQKNFSTPSSSNLPKTCSGRVVRGRLAVLANPIGHFDVLAPLEGCGNR